MVYSIELSLEGRTIHTLARTVWTEGPLQAMRYVGISDVDRLEIAEVLDEASRRGAILH